MLIKKVKCNRQRTESLLN